MRQLPAYALAIFDFDGTLADSWHVMGSAIAEAADRFGYRRPTPGEVEELRGRDNRAIMQALGVRSWQLPGIALHMRQVALQQIDRVALFAGVPEMLAALQGAGVRIAVVSSNGEEAIRAVLGPELAGLVADYDCGASLFGKSSRFRRVVRRAGVPAAQAIGIGDEARDIDAARAAGIAAGAVTWGYATAELLRSRAPVHVFESVDDITRALA